MAQLTYEWDEASNEPSIRRFDRYLGGKPDMALVRVAVVVEGLFEPSQVDRPPHGTGWKFVAKRFVSWRELEVRPLGCDASPCPQGK
jgi:hypothetical protein